MNRIKSWPRATVRV